MKKNSEEDWLEKCLKCQHVYRKQDDAEMVNVISSKRSYANSLPSAHKSKTYSLWLVPAPALLLYKDIKKKTIAKDNRGE